MRISDWSSDVCSSDLLVHRVLDQRPVDDRQHFFRNGLGGGEGAGAKARDGENGLPDSFRHVLGDALAGNATTVPTLRGSCGESAGMNSGTAARSSVASSTVSSRATASRRRPPTPLVRSATTPRPHALRIFGCAGGR